ncbi:ComEC family competence protein [Aquimarina sp. AD10]|uniref:ComEC/Rec2 family competence protein n=1 Tax=Aquimarina sp. AD10 TaxID=1714849 RepID=UPI000E49E9CC|nr:ComEC/Rec2 family competence protein [Aquimarina sp. AD10]AXT61301.1 ComEC family competence protein [Aquimarina sp. AD10]RKN01504.1 DUF4131 domain-containing protein [Aquimarina sp. AD10]
MRLINVPFVIITCATLLGIVVGHYCSITLSSSILLFSISILVLTVVWWRSKKIFSKGYYFGFLTTLIFIFFGIALIKIHDPKNNSNHYTNQIDSGVFLLNKVGVKFHIAERLKSTTYYDKYIVSLHILNQKLVEGNLLLRLPKDNTNRILEIGETYSFLGKITPIDKPLNPHQFDYKQHLSHQKIFHQATASTNLLIRHKDIQWSIFRIADQIRKDINQKLKKYSFNTRQLSIINALLLGQRQEITQETFNAYRDAGAIHILAVSGLHVGILLLIINWITSPLKFSKNGKHISVLLSIILLWCFAIIAGLSPSVLRAVTMFSFLTIGIQIQSKTSIYNSLCVSMFVLLCFNPSLLFSVGFQLSYLAVFSIVWIQPIMAKTFHPRFYITKKLWETFTVTFAAQLGLLPITLFYFHQFPGLFFISNLIIIPTLGLILGLGILVIALAYTTIPSQAIILIFKTLIDTMNNIVIWVSQQKSFLITDISFSWKTLITLSLVICTSITLFKKYQRRKIYWLVVSLNLFFTGLIIDKYIVDTKEEFIIFHTNRNTVFGVLKNQKLNLYHKDSLSYQNHNFLLKNYLIQNKAKIDSTYTLKNIYRYKKHTIQIIDHSNIYSLKGLQPDILLLSGSPKIHLERIIRDVQPKQIIADGSNYKNYIDQWEKSCTILNISFYRTDKNGAFLLKQ